MPEPAKILPPSTSTSTCRSVTPSATNASCTALMVRSRASTTTSGPCSASSASVPAKRRNAMLPIRCSGSVRPGARKSVRTCGSSPDGGSRRSMTGVVGGADSDGRRQRSSSVPSARVRVAPGASCSAVCAETAISPAIAADSVSIVAVTSAPTTTSSRWLEPTRKKGNSAEWRPTDMVSSSRPMALGVRLLSRMLRRISTAADAARVACPSPWKRNSSASPPNLRSIPPRASAMSSIAPNTSLSVSTSASAPTRPCRTSRSVSAVNPEMSAKHKVPSTNRVRVRLRHPPSQPRGQARVAPCPTRRVGPTPLPLRPSWHLRPGSPG